MTAESHAPAGWARPVGAALPAALRAYAQRRRWLVWLVGAPTLLVALYMSLLAAPQYESEARFLVRSQGSSGTSVLGQVLSGAISSPATEDANGVVSFLKSHDAVKALSKDVDLVAVWRRNGLDLLSGVKARPPTRS